MRRPARLWLVCLLLAGCSRGCDDDGTVGTASDLASGPVEILDVSFEELYPYFLARKSMSQGDKAALWRKYEGRWVRWEGVITSITSKGITVKHLLTTTTFDVSLICENATVLSIPSHYRKGDRVRYVGRLSTYDDIFRTMYLMHGMVLAKVPKADLGTVPDLAHPVVPGAPAVDAGP